MRRWSSRLRRWRLSCSLGEAAPPPSSPPTHAPDVIPGFCARCPPCSASGQVQAGEPVLLVYPPSLDFLVAFLACLRAGLIAVPVYPPGKLSRC